MRKSPNISRTARAASLEGLSYHAAYKDPIKAGLKQWSKYQCSARVSLYQGIGQNIGHLQDVNSSSIAQEVPIVVARIGAIALAAGDRVSQSDRKPGILRSGGDPARGTRLGERKHAPGSPQAPWAARSHVLSNSGMVCG